MYFEDAYVPQNVKEFLKVRHFEEKVNQRFNLTMSKFGWKDTRWGRLSIWMFGLWTILTSFCCFEKVDFVNVSTIWIKFVMFYFFSIVANRWYHGAVFTAWPTTNKTFIFALIDIFSAYYFDLRRRLDLRKILRVLGWSWGRWLGVGYFNARLHDVCVQANSFRSLVESIA